MPQRLYDNLTIWKGRKGGKNSWFTAIKTDFPRIAHHSACALIFYPYSTTGLTCWPFCMIIAWTLNDCFSRSNTKFTLIHKCTPLPINQHGVQNRDKAYSRFASPICDYLLFNRKKYKFNCYLGMKDMLRDIDARSWNICNYCNMANLAELFLNYWTRIFLHPTVPGYLLHRPCYHLVLFLSGIVLYRFRPQDLVFALPSWGLVAHVLLRALQTLARSSPFPIKEYAHVLCRQETHSLPSQMLLDPHNRQVLPKLEKTLYKE